MGRWRAGGPHTATVLVVMQTMASQPRCPPVENSLLFPRLAQFARKQKEPRRQHFQGQEMVAFYARQASSEIQNKTHHCEREYEIKGAFITLGSALFEILTFPL